MAITDRFQGYGMGVAVKPPCTVASTASLTLSGAQTVDGIAVGSCERVLVKDQSDAKTNGIYLADTAAWRRAADFDGRRDAIPGTQVYVDRGAAYGRVFFAANSSSTAISIDIASTGDDVTWSQITPSVTDVSAGTVIATGSPAERSLDDRFGEIINVRDFGALGDGVTSDTTSIQDAFTRLKTLAQGSVYFPSGTYQSTAKLVTFSETGKRYRIYGDGPASRIQIAGNLGGYLFEVKGVASGNGNHIKNVHFEDFSIDGNSRMSTGDVFLMQYCDEIDLTNIWVQQVAGHVIYADEWWDSSVTRNKFIGCGVPSTLDNKEVINIGSSDTSNTCNGLRFDDVRLESSWNESLYLGPNSRTCFMSIKTHGNQSTSFDVPAVHIDGGHLHIFSECLFAFANQSHIYITRPTGGQNPYGNIIVGSQFKETEQNSTYIGYAVHFGTGGNITGTQIRNNQFGLEGDMPSGVFIFDSTGAQDTVISGNVIASTLTVFAGTRRPARVDSIYNGQEVVRSLDGEEGYSRWLAPVSPSTGRYISEPFYATNSTGDKVRFGEVRWITEVVTASTERGKVSTFLKRAGADQETFSLDVNVSTGESVMLVGWNNAGSFTFSRVNIGSTDTGGSGQRVLTVDN